jgi:hypothetical protein
MYGVARLSTGILDPVTGCGTVSITTISSLAGYGGKFRLLIMHCSADKLRVTGNGIRGSGTRADADVVDDPLRQEGCRTPAKYETKIPDSRPNDGLWWLLPLPLK